MYLIPIYLLVTSYYAPIIKKKNIQMKWINLSLGCKSVVGPHLQSDG